MQQVNPQRGYQTPEQGAGIRCALLPLMSSPSSRTGPRCTRHGTSQGSQWPSEHEEEPKSDIPAVPGSTGASSSLNAPCGDASLLEG